MKLSVSKNADVNYLAKIVEIKEFHKHPNPEVERLKCCTIDGFNVITGINSNPGLYVYFPILSQINSDLLGYCNLYRHTEKNRNLEEKGMFEDNGRVNVVKLKGVPSEGFILEYPVFESWLVSVTNQIMTVSVGTEFDSIKDDDKTLIVCKKYKAIRQGYHTPKGRDWKKKFNLIIDSQFRFHYDTVLVKKSPYLLQPDGIIQISSKIHGTSGISAYVICKKKLSLKDKIVKWLTSVEPTEYRKVYSSRNRIRNGTIEDCEALDKRTISEQDIWWHANRIVESKLTKGLTAYYEIVGYQPDGRYIQKNYDYGCIPPEKPELMCHEENFKVRIYRLTYTNVDGHVFEFSPEQIRQWCTKVGLVTVDEFWTGKACELYPDIPVDDNWNTEFINRLSNDTNFYMEQDSPDCNNKVAHEGIVIRMLYNPKIAVKLKCFRFLSGADSSTESNIEDEN